MSDQRLTTDKQRAGAMDIIDTQLRVDTVNVSIRTGIDTIKDIFNRLAPKDLLADVRRARLKSVTP